MTVRLARPNWHLPGTDQNFILSTVSSNLGFAPGDAIDKEISVSGSVIANIGQATVKDTSLLVLVRDNLAITEGYGDARWAEYQLRTWPHFHNFPGAIIGADQPQQWMMRVKVYTLEPRDVMSLDRPCLYLSVRPNDRNIYHWVFETLPRLKCLQLIPQLRNLPLLVREPVSKLQSAFLKWMGINQEFIVTGGRSVRANSLFFASIPAPPPIHPELACWLRETVARDVELPRREFRRKLFISRRDSSAGRYVTNEDELAQKLAEIGFERLVMSELSPAEQIAAFRQAELIVLPHGAAGAFLPFCPPDCKLIELQTPKQINGVFYAHWKMQGRRYGYIVGQSRATNLDYWVDPTNVFDLISVAARDGPDTI